VEKPTVLMIGGPETGKSNFLFRVWTHLDLGDGLIEKDGLPSEAGYLQDGAESQLRGEFAGHTPVEEICNIPIRLRSDKQKSALLTVPDIHGEQINRIYRDRRWPKSFETLITNSTGYLFFVRVGSPQTVAPLDWITCHRFYGEAPEPVDMNGQSELSVAVAVEPPTQVILVDWLQFIFQALQDKEPNRAHPRVGIVVSAWDSVPHDFEGGPRDWVKENLPLLWQFCLTNQDVFEFAFFGTSIFSGDPGNDPEFAEELKHKDPRTLGYVLNSSDKIESNDFTIPIVWALGWQFG
jgi:hypothetical protein